MDRKFEIWLAEDDLEDFELFREVLTSSPHQFTLVHYATGFELWESLCKVKDITSGKLPDLVVLDQFMPQKSGWEILEMIKADKAFKNIVVVMMSGTYTQDNIDNGFRMGMDGYIQKPVFIGEWKAIIDKLILTWRPDYSEGDSDKDSSADNQR